MMKTLLTTLILIIHSSIIAQSDTTIITYFQSDSSKLSEAAQGEIIESLSSLKEGYDILGVKVEGYCDDVGSDAYNQKLSEARASEVASFLKVALRLSEIKSLGKGEIRLTSSGETDAVQREKNRKAEMVFSIRYKAVEVEILEEIEPIEEAEVLPSYLAGDLKVGDKIVLEGILFVGNKAIILAESLDNTKSLLEELKANPNVSVQIQGHIYDPYYYNDNIPSPETDNLSERRAKKVYNYLVENGIDKARLSYIGFEGKYPLGGDPKNDRRVEIEITGLD